MFELKKSSLSIHDDLLRQVIKHGNIEDITTKKRISKRFGLLVCSEIFSSEKFDTNVQDWNDGQLMELIRHISLLSSFSDFNKILKSENQVEQLAIINQKITYFHDGSCKNYNHSNILLYIQQVKEINQGYIGCDIKCKFPLHLIDSMNEKYQDMQLKIFECRRYEIDRFRSRCNRIVLKGSKDKLRNMYLFVTEVVLEDVEPNYSKYDAIEYEFDLNENIYSRSNIYQNLKYLPNIQKLDIKLERLNLEKILKYSSEVRNLQYLNISCATSIGDLKYLKLILDEYRIKTLKYNGSWSEENFEEVIDAVINSSNTTIKHFEVPIFKISGRKMVISKGRRYLTRDKKLFLRILKRFNRIDTIDIDCLLEQVDLDTITDACKTIEYSDDHRFIKVNIFYDAEKIFVE